MKVRKGEWEVGGSFIVCGQIDHRDWTPLFRRERIPGEEDYELIRFMAGPPYEDIAFKIVKKEWELKGMNGYKNSFDRGVLHLYFNFRRFFYRR